jgi:hypothetical protein
MLEAMPTSLHQDHFPLPARRSRHDLSRNAARSRGFRNGSTRALQHVTGAGLDVCQQALIER